MSFEDLVKRFPLIAHGFEHEIYSGSYGTGWLAIKGHEPIMFKFLETAIQAGRISAVVGYGAWLMEMKDKKPTKKLDDPIDWIQEGF